MQEYSLYGRKHISVVLWMLNSEQCRERFVKRKKLTDDLDKAFGVGNYIVVADCQAFSLENNRKLDEAIKAGQVDPKTGLWFSEEIVKNSTVKFNGHDF